MVEGLKKGPESKGFFDNMKESIINLKNQILGKNKEKNLESKKNIVALKELKNQIIEKNINDLDEKQNKTDKPQNGNKIEKIMSNFVSNDNAYLVYGKNSDNPIDEYRGEEANNLLSTIKDYKTQENILAYGSGWVLDKLLN